jgi:predicted GH43/DUF377 family glycosyl hydrolase
MEDDYMDYISFRDGKENTILKSSIVVQEIFTLDTSEKKHSANLNVQKGIVRLPLVDPSATEFNSSIIAYDTSTKKWTPMFNKSTCTLYMAYRHQRDGHSSVWIGELSLTHQKIMNAKQILVDPHIHYEDPRLFTFQNELYVSYSFFGSETEKDWDVITKTIRIGMTRIRKAADGFECGPTYVPPFGNNAKPIGVEKNWGFFEKGKELHCLYSISPFVIFKYDMAANTCRLVRTSKTKANLSLRGGTPPLYINKQFVAFIHCSDYLSYRFDMTFDSNQFTLKSIGDFPALSAIQILKKGTQYMNQNGILFPCGAVYDTVNKQYIVAMGYDDKENMIAYVKA